MFGQQVLEIQDKKKMLIKQVRFTIICIPYVPNFCRACVSST
jgi:hypothetical protein